MKPYEIIPGTPKDQLLQIQRELTFAPRLNELNPRQLRENQRRLGHVAFELRQLELEEQADDTLLPALGI